MSRLVNQIMPQMAFQDTLNKLYHLKAKQIRDLCFAVGINPKGTKKSDAQELVETLLRKELQTTNHAKLYAIRDLIIKASSDEPLPRMSSFTDSGRDQLTKSSEIPSPELSIPINEDPYLSLFQKSHFYKCKRIIIPLEQYPIKTIQAKGKTKRVSDTARLTLIFTTEEKNLMRLSGYKLYLFCCISDETKSKKIIYFPSPAKITFNSKELSANTKGIKGKIGSINPVDLTEHVQFDGRNHLDIKYMESSGNSFEFYVYLVETVNIERIEQKVLDKEHITKGETINLLNDDGDGVQMSSETVQLLCPCSLTRIQHPVRSIKCKHVQCFDLLSYISLQRQAPTWICPVCQEELMLKNVRVDDYFETLLDNITEDYDYAVVKNDGSFEPRLVATETEYKIVSKDLGVTEITAVSIKEEANRVIRVPENDVVVIDSEEDYYTDESQDLISPANRNKNKPKARVYPTSKNLGSSPSASSQGHPEVIVLDSDSEEEIFEHQEELEENIPEEPFNDKPFTGTLQAHENQYPNTNGQTDNVSLISNEVNKNTSTNTISFPTGLSMEEGNNSSNLDDSLVLQNVESSSLSENTENIDRTIPNQFNSNSANLQNSANRDPILHTIDVFNNRDGNVTDQQPQSSHSLPSLFSNQQVSHHNQHRMSLPQIGRFNGTEHSNSPLGAISLAPNAQHMQTPQLQAHYPQLFQQQQQQQQQQQEKQKQQSQQQQYQSVQHQHESNQFQQNSAFLDSSQQHFQQQFELLKQTQDLPFLHRQLNSQYQGPERHPSSSEFHDSQTVRPNLPNRSFEQANDNAILYHGRNDLKVSTSSPSFNESSGNINNGRSKVIFRKTRPAAQSEEVTLNPNSNIELKEIFISPKDQFESLNGMVRASFDIQNCSNEYLRAILKKEFSRINYIDMNIKKFKQSGIPVPNLLLQQRETSVLSIKQCTSLANNNAINIISFVSVQISKHCMVVSQYLAYLASHPPLGKISNLEIFSKSIETRRLYNTAIYAVSNLVRTELENLRIYGTEQLEEQAGKIKNILISVANKMSLNQNHQSNSKLVLEKMALCSYNNYFKTFSLNSFNLSQNELDNIKKIQTAMLQFDRKYVSGVLLDFSNIKSLFDSIHSTNMNEETKHKFQSNEEKNNYLKTKINDLRTLGLQNGETNVGNISIQEDLKNLEFFYSSESMRSNVNSGFGFTTYDGNLNAREDLADNVNSDNPDIVSERRQQEAKRVAEANRKQEDAKRLAEEKRKQEEAKRLAEEKRKQEETKRIDEEKRKQEEAKLLAEAKRKQEEAKRIDEEKRKQEEAKRLAEEKRKQEETKRLAEEKKKQEEAKRLVEEKRKQEEAKRLAEEKRKQEEVKRLVEEKRKQEEAKRLADEKKKADSLRRAAEQKRKAEETRRAIEQKRKDDEAKRSLDLKKKLEVAKRVEEAKRAVEEQRKAKLEELKQKQTEAKMLADEENRKKREEDKNKSEEAKVKVETKQKGVEKDIKLEPTAEHNKPKLAANQQSLSNILANTFNNKPTYKKMKTKNAEEKKRGVSPSTSSSIESRNSSKQELLHRNEIQKIEDKFSDKKEILKNIRRDSNPLLNTRSDNLKVLPRQKSGTSNGLMNLSENLKKRREEYEKAQNEKHKSNASKNEQHNKEYRKYLLGLMSDQKSNLDRVESIEMQARAKGMHKMESKEADYKKRRVENYDDVSKGKKRRVE